MNRRLLPGERVFGYLMLLFSAFLFHQSYKIAGFSSISSAGGWPMAAAGMMVLCSLLIVLRNGRLPKADPDGAAAEFRRFRAEIFPPRPLIGYVGIILAYMLAIEPMGFNLSSFLFLFASFWYLHRRGLLLTLGLSVGSVVIIYTVFQLIFRVILPEAEWLDGLLTGLGG